MFTIILIIAISAILYLGLSSIKLHLKFNESRKFIDLTYTLIKFRLLFNDMTVQIYIAGIGIKRFNLIEAIFAKRVKRDEEIKRKVVAKKKKRKFDWTSYLELKKMRWYLKKLSYPIRKIKIKYLNIEISDGFSDPYYTGQLYAAYSTIAGIFPKLMSHINFRPDFSADSLKINGEGLVKLRLCYILLPILQILADKIFGKAGIPTFRLKKGTSYV